MYDFIDNNHYIGKDDVHEGKADQINVSHELDTLSEKLNDGCLASNAFCVIRNEEKKKKAHMYHLISAVNAVFWLIKAANNRPIFMLMDNYSCENTQGFYFFIGQHDEIKEKLIKLADERSNLKEQYYKW
jgi:hypothetical protein